MATIKSSIIGVCFVLGSFSVNSQSCIKQTYDTQIGIRELTGKNDGKDVEKYLASCGLSKGNAWCAAFVNWTLKQCGFKTVKNPAWSPSWFVANVIWERSQNSEVRSQNNSPSAGDVFGIWFENKQRIAHVGFIDEWNEGSFCITVEGNTNEAGSREGDGVYRKRRLKKQIYKVSRYSEK